MRHKILQFNIIGNDLSFPFFVTVDPIIRNEVRVLITLVIIWKPDRNTEKLRCRWHFSLLKPMYPIWNRCKSDLNICAWFAMHHRKLVNVRKKEWNDKPVKMEIGSWQLILQLHMRETYASFKAHVRSFWKVWLYWWWKKNLRLQNEFSFQACNDIVSFFQKRVSESVGFALLVYITFR